MALPCCGRFFRAYVDPNREPWNPTPDVPWGFARASEYRIAKDIGGPRDHREMVTSGDEIYADKLDIEEGWRKHTSILRALSRDPAGLDSRDH